MLALLGCRDDPTDPADILSSRSESAHYVYLHSAGDAVDAVSQERYHEWLLGQLGIDPASKLEYRKYRDRAHLRRMTGRNTNGFAEPGTLRFHSIWPYDNHESVHALVVVHMGHPPALFNEGMAVAHQAISLATGFEVRWNGRALDAIAAEHLLAGRLPALEAVLESPRFFDFDENLMYPVAGSFVRYLISRHGWTPLKQYIATSAFSHSASQTRAAFAAAYGLSVDDAWAAWRLTLGGSSVSLENVAPAAPLP